MSNRPSLLKLDTPIMSLPSQPGSQEKTGIELTINALLHLINGSMQLSSRKGSGDRPQSERLPALDILIQ